MMKKNKTLFLFLISIVLTNSSFAQDREIVSVNGLFEIFLKLSDNIDKLIDEQEAKRLYRHLDYFKNDMNRYLVVRKEITNYLETENYSSFDTLRVQEAVLNLDIQIIKLGKRLETIEPYANETLLDGTDGFLDDIEDVTQGQRVKFLNKLKDFSNGEQVDKIQLEKDGRVIFGKLKDSIVLIDKIKGQLKKKFSL